MQVILVLVGVPGSGKTTVSEILREDSVKWTWINEDTLGNRKACEDDFWRALGQGRDVIVDRCNHTVCQRQTWVQLAFEMQRRLQSSIRLVCLALETAPSVCQLRAVQRTGHTTLASADAPAVIDRFLSEYQPPSVHEGFHHVFRVATPQQLQHILETHLLTLPGSAYLPPPQQPYTLPSSLHAFHPDSGPRHWPQAAISYQQHLQQHSWSGHPAGPPVPEPASAGGAHGSRGHLAEGGNRVSRLHDQPAGASLHLPRASLNGSQQAGQHPRNDGWKRHFHDVDLGNAQEAVEVVNVSDKLHLGQHSRLHPLLPQYPHAAQRLELQQSVNIVPFGKSSAALGGGHVHHGRQLLDDDDDPRPIVLWDMNGTLTSHTHTRRSSGRNIARPGTHHLRRLASKFRVGVFTSASKRTVSVAVNMLEKQAGDGPRIFDPSLLLHRVHTEPAPQSHMVAGGNTWDTVKPLHKYFGKLHRVILMDDDAYKALDSEQGNMLHVPCWEDENPQDQMVLHFVDALLQVFGSLPRHADVREHTAMASRMLFDTAKQLAEQQLEQEAQQHSVGTTQHGLSELGTMPADPAMEPRDFSPPNKRTLTNIRPSGGVENPEEIHLDI